MGKGIGRGNGRGSLWDSTGVTDGLMDLTAVSIAKKKLQRMSGQEKDKL